jgi:hydrogenase maturation protein HypF
MRGATTPSLAVGAHLKNTVALAVNENIFVSQHIGDLDNKPSYDAFRAVIDDLSRLYEVSPERLVCDLHPDYISTQYARSRGGEIVAVQHHLAHVLACMAENEIDEPVLGVSWDGTGYGLDGTVWGGEFIVIGADRAWQRVAHLRTFPLPGGEAAVREPRRAAIGLLYEMMGDVVFKMDHLACLRAFARAELESVKTMLHRRLRCPLTSSAGRLFDAVASLVGLHQVVRFEGQAAMELEYAADAADGKGAYEFRCANGIVDWEMMIHGILEDVRGNVPVAAIAARFHNTLADMIVAVAAEVGIRRVVLSGGCFQNARLAEQTVARLEMAGFQPAWHQRIPPNDGGIALGQLAAAYKLKNQMVVTVRPNQETSSHVPRGTRKDFEHPW